MTHRLEITVSDETWDRLNAARGHEPRASFVKRWLERGLDSHDGRVELRAEIEELKRDPERLRAMLEADVDVAKPAEKPVANVLGSSVRKVPSLKDTWGR